jgi:hypothetical protein
MPHEPVQMISECADSYNAIDLPDGRIQILINIPRRFRDLWLVKLNDLMASDEELHEYAP